MNAIRRFLNGFERRWFKNDTCLNGNESKCVTFQRACSENQQALIGIDTSLNGNESRFINFQKACNEIRRICNANGTPYFKIQNWHGDL